jgi:polyvinyl alcohol dehydrogenase (cytochrome)
VLAAAVAAASLGVPSAAAADWPIYGHDLGNTRNAGQSGPPAAQVAALQPAWKFDSPTGDFTGTPVVADGTVVAGDHGGWVYALDAVTGKLRWSKDLGAPVNGTAAIDLDAPRGPAVYVPVAQLGRPHLVALSLTSGAPLWDAVLTDQPKSSVYGSPVYWNGSVYIGTSGPNNDDATARGSVVALDEATGGVRWQTFTAPPGADGVAVWSTPAIDTATGRLYVGTGNNYHQPTTDLEDSIVALDAGSGRVLDHFQATANDSFSAADNPAGPDYDFGASPNLVTGANGQSLLGEGQKSGAYWMLDRATMRPLWSTSVGPGGPLGGILGSTASDATRVYGGTTLDGGVFALDRGGAQSWHSMDTGGLHLGAATIANGVLYTTDPNGAVNARDPATGAILAKLPLDRPSLGGISAVGGALYVAVGTGPLPQPAPQADSPGSIVALGDTAGAARAPLRLSVTPRRVRAGRLVRLRFRASQGSRAVAGVKVHIGPRRVRTGAAGLATVRLRFHRPGTHTARAGRLGLETTRATLKVIAR